MNPKIILEKVQVLEYSKKDYTNKKGEAASFVELLVRFGGKVLKLACAKDVDLTPVVDKVVNLSVELATWGDNLTPVLRVVGVAK